jgi:hypothetical protein
MIILKALKMLLSVILGAIYLPINMLVNWLGNKLLINWKKDKVLFVLYGIVFVPVWIVAVIFSIPYEALVESAH